MTENITNKRLSETSSVFQEQLLSDNSSTTDTLKHWDLENWEIDIEQFRQESHKNVQNILENT